MFVLSPNTTATRRDILPMIHVPERAEWMGYEEYKRYLEALNLSPIARDVAIKEYCDRRGL